MNLQSLSYLVTNCSQSNWTKSAMAFNYHARRICSLFDILTSSKDFPPGKGKEWEYLQLKIIKWRESPLLWRIQLCKVLTPHNSPLRGPSIHSAATRNTVTQRGWVGAPPLYHAGDRAPWNPGATVKLGKLGWDDTVPWSAFICYNSLFVHDKVYSHWLHFWKELNWFELQLWCVFRAKFTCTQFTYTTEHWLHFSKEKCAQVFGMLQSNWGTMHWSWSLHFSP